MFLSVCVCVFDFVGAYMYLRICVQVLVCVYKYVCVCDFVGAYMYLCMCASVQVLVCVYKCVCVCV